MVLLAMSQHCPCAVAAPVDPLDPLDPLGDMPDCADAMDTPPASNAAAANAVSFVSFMTIPRWIVGKIANLGQQNRLRGVPWECTPADSRWRARLFVSMHRRIKLQQPRHIRSLASSSRSRLACSASA